MAVVELVWLVVLVGVALGEGGGVCCVRAHD